MEIEEIHQEEEESEEDVDIGPPRYEQVKLLFDPASLATYKSSNQVMTLRELYPPRTQQQTGK